MAHLARLFALLLLIASVAPLCASQPDDRLLDEQSIAALQARIGQAPARDQCFLYAELIHQMTELSLRQYSAGDVDKATALLQKVQEFAHKIHLTVNDSDKRLKNAEMLLRHTAFRLTSMLHSSSYEDRPEFERTIAQVNEADSATLKRVFQH
ncbi:MAG TPA: hypothetical protein VF392_16770 [Terracidiphilus sp.]